MLTVGFLVLYTPSSMLMIETVEFALNTYTLSVSLTYALWFSLPVHDTLTRYAVSLAFKSSNMNSVRLNATSSTSRVMFPTAILYFPETDALTLTLTASPYIASLVSTRITVDNFVITKFRDATAPV